MEPEKTTTFYGITITIQGSPKDAYRELCAIMSMNEDIIDEWSTDTFSDNADKDGYGIERKTFHLFDEYERSMD